MVMVSRAQRFRVALQLFPIHTLLLPRVERSTTKGYCTCPKTPSVNFHSFPWLMLRSSILIHFLFRLEWSILPLSCSITTKSRNKRVKSNNKLESSSNIELNKIFNGTCPTDSSTQNRQLTTKLNLEEDVKS